MMSKTKEFLENLSDCELSFLYTYKFSSYLSHSQQMVNSEIEKRNLTKDRIDKFVKDVEFNINNTGCPRCNSQVNITQQVEFHDTHTRNWKLNDKTAYTSLVECAVCGYKLHDGNETNMSGRGFWRLLRRVIGK